MHLSMDEKRQIFENGYAVLKNVIPRRMVDAALRQINHAVGEGMDPTQMPIFRAQSYCPELRNDPAIMDLLIKSPLWDLTESALGEGKIRPVRGGQIALRFPVLADPPRPVGMHLDGMYTPDNGVKQGTIANFTALIGVFLSDVETEYAGNFSVVAGSHKIYESYFREHGAEALLQGMPPVEVPPVQQLRARAGDAVLCHYQIAHGVAQNVSPHVRYAIFFRLHHVEMDPTHWQAPMQDIWMHWPGIRSSVPEAS